MAIAHVTNLASLTRDSRLQKAFGRVHFPGGDNRSGALVLPKRPEPVLIGGAAAELEAA